ncbi:hypothetical protein HRbin41_01323 [bacterium HR41]|nr:hypothetical protein HRbin41_01323 [bacterium HR41]
MRATAGTTSGPAAATPASKSSAPAPTTSAARPLGNGPSAPTSRLPLPAARRVAASRRRRRRVPRRGRSAGSRSAASGEMRVARRAGTSAAMSVTAIPTTRPTTIERGRTTVPVLGRSSPALASSSFRSGASTRPPATPTAAPSAPSASASAATRPNSCLRLAPSVRNSPNSAVRCATVIAKVLKIRKPPTTTATPAKTSSAVRKNESLERTSRACRSALSVAVSTR